MAQVLFDAQIEGPGHVHSEQEKEAAKNSQYRKQEVPEAGSAAQQDQASQYNSPDIPAFFDQFADLTNESRTDSNAPQLAAYVDPVTGRIGYRYDYGATPGVVTQGPSVVTPGRLGRTDIPTQDEIDEEKGPTPNEGGTVPVVGSDPAGVPVNGAGGDVPEAQGFLPNADVGGVLTKDGLDPYGLDPTTYTGENSGTFKDFMTALAASPIGTALKGFMLGGPVGAIAGSVGTLAKQGKEDFQNRPTDIDKFQAASQESMQGLGGVKAPVGPDQPTPIAPSSPPPQDPSRVDLAKGSIPQSATPQTGFSPPPDRAVEVGQSFTTSQDLAQFNAASQASIGPSSVTPATSLDPVAFADVQRGIADEIDAGKAQQASQQQLDQIEFDRIASKMAPVETTKGGFASTVVDVDTAAASADFDYSGLPDSGDTDFTAF